MLTSGVGLGDASLGACSYMTFRFSLLEKQIGENVVPLFFRVCCLCLWLCLFDARGFFIDVYKYFYQ
jgi:hypothetical protein